jgi:diacylglycerol kinase (ATP)
VEKRSGKGLARLWNAFGWSLAGLGSAVRHEEAFRQELIMAAILLPVGLWVGKGGTEKALLCSSVLLVLITELLNSGIESVVDRVSSEHHPLSGRAKDLGSAAVFIALINMVIVWGLVFFL